MVMHDNVRMFYARTQSVVTCELAIKLLALGALQVRRTFLLQVLHCCYIVFMVYVLPLYIIFLLYVFSCYIVFCLVIQEYELTSCNENKNIQDIELTLKLIMSQKFASNCLSLLRPFANS